MNGGWCCHVQNTCWDYETGTCGGGGASSSLRIDGQNPRKEQPQAVGTMAAF
jgi:hypothetical protein